MIALYNLEPKYMNIALEKIRMYYEEMKEQVVDYLPLEHQIYDKIYCSSLFTYTDKSQIPDDIICGGSGFDLTTVLPKEIECMKPKINIGFTTRGCIRKCSFCIVPEKEGKIEITGDIYDIWDMQSKNIVLLDNNILAKPKHFKLICQQIAKENLKVDFNQGLDHRLITSIIAKILKTIRYKEYRFAFDSMNYESSVCKTIEILHKNNIKWSMWYVLVGYDTTYREDLYRLELLKKKRQKAFVQRFNNQSNIFYNELAGWVNQHRFFDKYTFKEFVQKRGRLRALNEEMEKEKSLYNL